MSGRGKGGILRGRRSADNSVDVVARPYKDLVQRPLKISYESSVSLTSAGLIGGALGMTVPLLIIIGLLLCLVLWRGRLKILGGNKEMEWSSTKKIFPISPA